MEEIDWDLVFRFTPFVTAVFAFLLGKYFSDRPKLITYYGHSATHHIEGNTDNPEGFRAGAHSIVVRNAGRKPATNVRVSHRILPPDFFVWPDIPRTVEKMPGGGEDIVFPSIVSGQDVTISYLYFRDVGQIHTGIRSDEGIAKEQQVLLTPQLPRWAQILFLSLAAIGMVTALYLAALILRAIIP